MAGKPKAKGPRCTGRKADGRPCQAVPLDGSTRCWHHSYTVPGRPSKLTADIGDRIIDAVLEGAYLETAAQAAGVSPRTLHRWLARGDDAEARALEHFDSDAEPEVPELYEHLDPADWPYLDFRHALKATEGFAELELLRMVTRGHGRQPWTAYMTVLERRWPSRWGRRVEVKHDGAVDVGKPKEFVPDSDEKRAAILGVLRDTGILSETENTPTQED